MNKLTISPRALKDCEFWLKNDRKILAKIYKLFTDIARDPLTGLGKPEPLKGEEGYFSRRIDEKNRLVYKVEGEFIETAQCRNHYFDK